MKVQISADLRDLFRPLTEDELEQSKANNLADPQHERVPPVVIWQCGKDWTIVDGHHTHTIRENLRVNGKPAKIRYHKMEFPDRQSAIAYAIHAQLGRRNLNSSQVAIALAKLPKSAPGRPAKKGDQLDPISGPSREDLADEAGIGRTTMKRADKVNERGAKAVVEAVTAGDVSVSDAASVTELPKKEQVAALKKVKQGKSKTLKSAAPKKPTKPPKKLDRNAYYKQWDAAIGPLVRLVDKIASGVGESRNGYHKQVQTHLNNATTAMQEWMGVKK